MLFGVVEGIYADYVCQLPTQKHIHEANAPYLKGAFVCVHVRLCKGTKIEPEEHVLALLVEFGVVGGVERAKG